MSSKMYIIITKTKGNIQVINGIFTTEKAAHNFLSVLSKMRQIRTSALTHQITNIAKSPMMIWRVHFRLKRDFLGQKCWLESWVLSRWCHFSSDLVNSVFSVYYDISCPFNNIKKFSKKKVNSEKFVQLK